MSAAVAAAIRELPGFTAGREAERDDVVRALRLRASSVANMTKHGRLTADEGARLKRWLEATADDIEAGLHESD